MPMTPAKYGRLCDQLHAIMEHRWTPSKVTTTYQDFSQKAPGRWVFRFRYPLKSVTLVVREDSLGDPCDAFAAWRMLDHDDWHGEMERAALVGGVLELTKSGLHHILG